MKKILASVVCFLSFAGPVVAGQIAPRTDSRPYFNHLTVNDGLTSYAITSVVQAFDGRVLIGTYDGLNFFDGYNVTFERHSVDRPEGLSNNRIVCMEPARDSTVWLGLDGGVVRYDLLHNRYTDYTASIGIETRKVRTVCQTASGEVWFGCENGVFRGIPDGRGGYEFVTVAGLGPFDIYCIREDARGNKWVATVAGLFICSGEGGRYVRQVAELAGQVVRWVECDPWGMTWVSWTGGVMASPDGQIFEPLVFGPRPGIPVVRTVRDAENHLWIGSNTSGLYSVELDKACRARSWENYAHSEDFGSISSDEISCMWVDPSQVLWVGTHLGLNYSNISPPDFYTFTPLLKGGQSELGYSGRFINALFLDRSDRLWVNAYRDGTFRYDFRTDRLEDISQQVTRSSVSRILQSRDGMIWLAAQEGIYRITEDARGGLRSSLISLPGIPGGVASHYRYFLDLAEDQHGDIWIATINGVIRYTPATGNALIYDRKYGLASSFAYCLAADTVHNIIWMGSADRGLSRIVYHRGSPEVEVQSIGRDTHPHALPSEQVWCLHLAPDGTLWVGTDAGFYRMDIRNGELCGVEHIKAPSLDDAKILAITPDAAGDLWLSSSQGLYRYSPPTGAVRRYISEDGLQSDTWTEGAVRSSNGWIFVGGVNGVNYFNPERFIPNSYAGRPVFTAFKVHNRPVEAGVEYDGRVLLDRSLNAAWEVTLAYRQNNFTVEFSSDHYATPSKNLFRYRLEGYDNDWIEVGAGQRFATYNGLGAGTYTFLLCSSNNEGVWSEQVRSFCVRVLPPWWQSWWAWTIYILVFGAIAFGMLSYILSRQLWKHKLFMQRIEQEKTQELAEMKLGFYTNITHELRTPLSLITAPLKDLLSHGTSDEYTRVRLDLINRNVGRLLLLINQILEIRRVSAQNLSLTVAPWSLPNTIREVAQSFGYLSEQTGIIMHIDLPESMPDTWFDRDKIEKIVLNLISNAYKFTPGHGNIRVALHEEVRGGVRTAVVSVQDSGVGIPAADIHKVFDLFYHTTPINGVSSGVGLSLSKALIELHRGDISVASEQDKGTVFTVCFPVERDFYPAEQRSAEGESREEAVPKGQPGEEESVSGHLVLIVEDNEDMQAYITHCLRGHFRTAVAADGLQALALSQKLSPDVVISDIMMPSMDGIEFIRRMKADQRTNFIPIIVHSAKDDKPSIREALAAGAQEYIVKPFEAENLILRIENLLSAREHLARKLKTETITEPSAVQLPSDDEQLLRSLTTIVEANMHNPQFDIEQLAAELHMSRMQLYRRMRNIAGGKTVSEVIRDMRIKRAAQLLASGSKRVNEVMVEVGMNNHYRFARYFQETYGMSPKEYMQMHAGMRKGDSKADE